MAIEEKENRKIYDQNFVRSLFDSIANKYDLLNRILSFGIDICWRKRAIELIIPLKPKQILDIATGTADFAIEATKIESAEIIGIDISSNMLELGRNKIMKLKLENRIILEEGEAENLKYQSNSFDVVMCAFGVRNFHNLQQGLKETFRVLRNNGILLILEFARPNNTLIRFFYYLYSNYVIPIVGRIISKNQFAYRYLPETVSKFPSGNEFCSILTHIGFKETRFFPQTFGIATIYIAEKVNS